MGNGAMGKGSVVHPGHHSSESKTVKVEVHAAPPKAASPEPEVVDVAADDDAPPPAIAAPGGPSAGGAAPVLQGPPAMSGLAARRAAQGKLPGGLAVAVEKKVNPRKIIVNQLGRSKDGQSMRRIERVEDFHKMFKIGGEVMPSVHPGMDIRHATFLKDGTKVVIKIRRKQNSFISQAEEREWRQSAEFMMNLPQSTSIAEVHGVYEDKDAYYVVMERVGGSDLFELLDAEGLLPLQDTKAILRQLLKGVAALHETGCIHKDLKLENIMVDRSSKGNRNENPDPIVKLIDFDTAQSWEPDSPKAKTVLGTDQYISAEAYAGNYSPASDIFAVGVIAYKLVTGYFPFNAKIFDDQAGDNWVGSPKMKEIQHKVSQAKINWNLKPFPSEPQAVALIKSMLAPDEMDRPEAEEALNHPFLADVMSPLPRQRGAK